MINVLAVIVSLTLFFGLCKIISRLSKGTINEPCPKCGGVLHYHITEEMNKNGLRYVDYECENCGWTKRLPEEE